MLELTYSPKAQDVAILEDSTGNMLFLDESEVAELLDMQDKLREVLRWMRGHRGSSLERSPEGAALS